MDKVTIDINMSGTFYESEIVLIVLFIIYLTLGLKTPQPIANIVDTLVGKIVIFIIKYA